MSRHHKNNLEHRLHDGKCHWIRHFMSMALVALIMAACAPGTGGTGTGPIVSSASLTSAQTLLFVNPSLTPPPLAPSPTGERPPSVSPDFAVLDSCASTQNLSTPYLIFSAQGIEYQQACYGFRYLGAWDISAGQALSVKGTLVNLNNPKIAIPAVLTIVTSSALDTDNASVTVTLADENNQIKLPSQDIRRSPKPP
jgi:hypothetical protein